MATRMYKNDVGGVYMSEDTHTMVDSVRGPKMCCKECSLRAKTYVEWPCSAVLLLTFSLLSSIIQENTYRAFAEELGSCTIECDQEHD